MAVDPDVEPTAADRAAIDLYAGLQVPTLCLAALSYTSPRESGLAIERCTEEYLGRLRRTARDVFGLEGPETAA